MKNKLLRILPDIIAICAIAGLAALGKLGVETACGFILAITSGRLYPRKKIGARADDDEPPSDPRPNMPSTPNASKPDKKTSKKIDDDDDDVPSGIATIIFFVLSLVDIAAEMFHRRNGA